MERSDPVNTEEEETGTSLFHRLMNQRKDLHEDEVVCVFRKVSLILYSLIIETFSADSC